MRSGISKRTLNLLLIFVLLPIPMAIMDWNHFFPLSAQPDLQFQITGELLELATLVGTAVLMSFGIAKARGDGKKAGTGVIYGLLVYGLLVAASFSAFLFTLSWRDFFPDYQFNLSAVHPRRLASVLLAGLIFSCLGFFSESLRSKPGGANEKSVV